MIPDIYKFIDNNSEFVLMPKEVKKLDSRKDMSAHEYVVSGKAFEKNENDAIIKNGAQLKKYLHTLKK